MYTFGMKFLFLMAAAATATANQFTFSGPPAYVHSTRYQSAKSSSTASGFTGTAVGGFSCFHNTSGKNLLLFYLPEERDLMLPLGRPTAFTTWTAPIVLGSSTTSHAVPGLVCQTGDFCSAVLQINGGVINLEGNSPPIVCI
ncbi:hypothetical protein DFH08DRAFT_811119 [Mycena albidolilacea]|uniref:Uncharacterized protein n=1 Tax=Mycena albidolilacea TaxID=1033008 RepID=A0AAD7EP47_9AGAR|nr:hypothetical protein DFH08DRAFT_811119 [Mycena albidolilacea]